MWLPTTSYGVAAVPPQADMPTVREGVTLRRCIDHYPFILQVFTARACSCCDRLSQSLCWREASLNPFRHGPFDALPGYLSQAFFLVPSRGLLARLHFCCSFGSACRTQCPRTLLV